MTGRRRAPLGTAARRNRTALAAVSPVGGVEVSGGLKAAVDANTEAVVQIGDCFYVVVPGAPIAAPQQPITKAGDRSPQWNALAKQTVIKHPYCAACGKKIELQVHHKIPFHVDPTKELDETNLIVLCRRDHLLIGHLDDWSSWNTAVVEEAEKLLREIRNRPYVSNRPDGTLPQS